MLLYRRDRFLCLRHRLQQLQRAKFRFQAFRQQCFHYNETESHKYVILSGVPASSEDFGVTSSSKRKRWIFHESCGGHGVVSREEQRDQEGLSSTAYGDQEQQRWTRKRSRWWAFTSILFLLSLFYDITLLQSLFLKTSQRFKNCVDDEPRKKKDYTRITICTRRISQDVASEKLFFAWIFQTMKVDNDADKYEITVQNTKQVNSTKTHTQMRKFCSCSSTLQRYVVEISCNISSRLREFHTITDQSLLKKYIIRN